VIWSLPAITGVSPSSGTVISTGVLVAASGALSGIFVVIVNAWMNTPAGVRWENGAAVDIRPFAAMLNPSTAPKVIHMTLASFVSVGFIVAAIHAWSLLRDPRSRFHRRAYVIALWVGGAAALLQPFSGDFSAVRVAEHQKPKLAAMEGQWKTQRRAPLRVGGWVDERAQRTRWALEIPGALSLLAYGDADAEVLGLASLPEKDRPPAAVVHMSFQVMVAAGTILAGAAALGAFLALRRRAAPLDRWYLRLVALCGPLGFLALEAGWIVTEGGRQPWMIGGILRVEDTVTPMPGLAATLAVVTALYLFLSFTVALLLRRLILETPPSDSAHA